MLDNCHRNEVCGCTNFSAHHTSNSLWFFLSLLDKFQRKLITFFYSQSVDKFFRVKHNKWNDDPIPSAASNHASKLIHKAEVIDEFRSKMNNTQGILIPNDLLLLVPLSDISANLLTSFRSFQQTLSDLSNCKSKSLSSVAADLFKLLNNLTENIGTLSIDGAALSNGIPEAFLSITNVIATLNIGTSVSDAVDTIKVNLLNVIRVFGEFKDSADSNITKKLNDAVFSLTMSAQVLIISTGIIAESGTTKLATITAEVKEGIVSLVLIVQAIILIVQNVISSIASIALSSLSDVSSTSSILNSIVVIIDRALPELTNVLSTITSTSIASSSSIIVSTISLTLTSLITRLNESIGKLQTSVVLEVPKTLEGILFKFIGSEADFVKYVTTSTAKIASSIVAISSSDAGTHSRVARQLYPVFQGLLQLTGSENDILVNLSRLLPSILDVLKSTTSNLFFGIGLELTKAFVTSIEEIFAALNKMTKILGREKINDIAMEKIVAECAKTVQVFGSIVMAITHAISGSIDTVNSSALEAIIALPILHSTVLYVVEWVTVLASSISPTKGNDNEILPSLAVTILAILKHDSIILELIAATVTRRPFDVVNFIASPVGELITTNSQLSSLSKVTAKSSVKIEQMSSGGKDVAVDGIKNTAQGSLSQILSGLTGSLSSISLTFSTSLNSFKSSFKQISTSEFGILQTLGSLLVSIVTELSDISGTATQILNVTSTLLHSIFGRLLDLTAKLYKLGDLVTSFGTSIANISTALQSLIYAIGNYKVTACFLIDSLRELAKTVQVIISTFSAIITSAASVDSSVLNSLVVEVSALPYLVSTIILCIQQVVGAAIPVVSEKSSGTIGIIQYDFTISMSSILENFASITAESTTFVTDGKLVSIPTNILSSVSDVNNYSSETLSKISGVLANIQVTLASPTS